jgi:hypothetical protein
MLLFPAAAVLLFLCFVLAHYDRQTGFTRFIYFGDHFASRRLPEVTHAHPFVFQDSDGYDGEFYAQIAVSPLLSDPGLNTALDSPAYRSRRIGLPWFAWLAGLGHTPWVLQAYALANVLAWLALAALLLHWIPPANATARLAWLGCLFGIGVMMSVERALTDVPAALCVATAIFLAERGRGIGAAVSFALALLTRDISVLAGGLLLPANRNGRAWLYAALLGVAALVPLALWSLHVRLRFPGVPSADPTNFALPFTAMFGTIATAWDSIPSRGWPGFVFQLLSTIGLCAQFLFLVFSSRRLWRERWWRVGAVFAVLFALLGPAVWEDYAAAARAVIPMTLAFNILLPRDQKWSFPLCALGNLPLLHGLDYLISPIWMRLP